MITGMIIHFTKILVNIRIQYILHNRKCENIEVRKTEMNHKIYEWKVVIFFIPFILIE